MKKHSTLGGYIHEKKGRRHHVRREYARVCGVEKNSVNGLRSRAAPDYSLVPCPPAPNNITFCSFLRAAQPISEQLPTVKLSTSYAFAVPSPGLPGHTTGNALAIQELKHLQPRIARVRHIASKVTIASDARHEIPSLEYFLLFSLEYSLADIAILTVR